MFPEMSNPHRDAFDAREVANTVLELCEYGGATLTQMQLYKLVYFAHGWHLATEGTPLVRQPFEAWKFGPVLGILRESFGQFGKNPIEGRAEKFDLITGEIQHIPSITDLEVRSFLQKIIEFYRAYDAWELSEITHERGSPWDKVWNSLTPSGNLGLRISETDIKNYFSSIRHRFLLN